VDDLVTITVSRNMLGQLLDGARERADAYERTAAITDDDGTIGYNPDDEFAPLEVSSKQEAEGIAAIYRTAIADVEAQLCEWEQPVKATEVMRCEICGHPAIKHRTAAK
jgi:hypothetical protein